MSWPQGKRKASTQLTISELFSAGGKKRKSGESDEPVAVVDDDNESDSTDDIQIFPGEDNAATASSKVRESGLSASSASASASTTATTINDVGQQYDLQIRRWIYLPSSLSSVEKRRLIDRHFVPGAKYEFPAVPGKDGKTRRFRHQRLSDNPWLVYSSKCEGGFCLPCLLFPSGADQGQLTASTCVNFKKATSLYEKHRQQRSIWMPLPGLLSLKQLLPVEVLLLLTNWKMPTPFRPRRMKRS